MTEQMRVNVSNTDLGKVEISQDVIEVIASICASEVAGVFAMQGNFTTGVAERLGVKNHRKGVKVEFTDDGIMMDLFVVLKSGVSIPKVAATLQENIRQTLKTMTALEISEINVHVVGIEMEDGTISGS